VVSEGEEWKKYGKVVALLVTFLEIRPELHSLPNPEYDCQRNNKLVWYETIRIMTDLFDMSGATSPKFFVDHCVGVAVPVGFLWLILYTWPAYQIALSVISTASNLSRSNCCGLMTAHTRVRPSDHIYN
jgi:hypothetical protein